VSLPLVTWLTGISSRALLLPAVHPWRDPCRRGSGDGMRVEPSLMHPEGGSWTEVRTHTPSKFSKGLTAPLAPIPLDHSKFRENGSQPPPNRTGYFRIIRLSSFPLHSVRNVSALRITRTSAPLSVGKPASLRRWAAFSPLCPCRRLSRPLTITEAPLPWGSRPVGNPTLYPCCTYEDGLGVPFVPL
jgi:hypothetical protein